MSLNAIINEIRSTSSKLEKRSLLAAQKDNALLREFLKAVYDPRIQYNTTKLPKVTKQLMERELCEDDVLDLTETLTGLRGKDNKEFLTNKLACLNADGRELVKYIIARDVDAGIAENSVLSVWPDLFFIPPYQRCASMDADLKERFGEMPFFYVQTKSDGQFVYAIKRGMGNEKSQAMSRAGSVYPEWLANAITYGIPEGYVAMGEMLVVRDGAVMSRKDGNGVLNSVLSGDGDKFLMTDSVRFVAWDMVTVEEFYAGRSDRPYSKRLEDLCSKTSLQRTGHWTIVGDGKSKLKEANRIHAEHIARKEEGTVWKNPDMLWRDCQTGDKDMMKAKIVFDFDAKITGAYVHKKNPAMLGGFDMESSDGVVQFSVGSGFTKQQRFDYWRAIQTNPEAFNGCIATCEGNDIVTSKSKPGKLSVFLPIFVELRLDKKEADSSDRMKEQLDAAQQGRTAAGV